MSNFLMIMLALNALVWSIVLWQRYRIKQNRIKLNNLEKERDEQIS